MRGIVNGSFSTGKLVFLATLFALKWHHEETISWAAFAIGSVSLSVIVSIWFNFKSFSTSITVSAFANEVGIVCFFAESRHLIYGQIYEMEFWRQIKFATCTLFKHSSRDMAVSLHRCTQRLNF